MKGPADEVTAPAPEEPTECLPVGNASPPPFRASLTLEEQPGAQVGRYKLLEKIGEGGFGVVYAAEQKIPIRRRVALKIIKPGMDTQSVVARFEAERQALAMMDHPNIAKVLDAGTTEAGRPYFVMELVRGVPITAYCDQNSLPPVQRLNLFIQVCQAIQHAHQKGIIHRDIKPSNILVTLHDGIPVPKVIDFGIAKATQGDLTDKTIYTQLQQVIGTPAYMSPEQAEMSGLDVDTRSDIYSLGVLLYELLTGLTPFDAKELMKAGMDEMRRTIRQTDPVRPSNRLNGMTGVDLTATAKRRGMDTHRLIMLLRGDLDWIVMKCLEKDRTRRYETANGLAVDVQRHLNNEPVFARPPSPVYRFQKMVGRNKLAFGASLAVLMALLLGTFFSVWQAVRATRAKRDAWAAQSSESHLRQTAQEDALVARRRAYASDMNVAMQALAENNLGRALDLLDRQRPGPGVSDLRGWEWRYLWQQTRSDALFTLCQKSNEIESLAVSADGRWLAIGVEHRDGLFVWDLQSRQEVAHLAQGKSGVRVAFSPKEPVLAFSCSEGPQGENTRLAIWNAATRQLGIEFSLTSYCAGLAFSQDGQTLVTSTVTSTADAANGAITLWRVRDGSQVASYPSQQYGFRATPNFAITGDLGIAACGLGNERIGVIDLRNGRELWTAASSQMPLAQQGEVTALAFSPDGKTLASADSFNDPDIHLWDVATGKELGRLKGHGSWIAALVFWPDGKRLASGSADQTIRTWDLASRTCNDVLHGHRGEVWRLSLLPDNRTLVSGCKDGSVCLWDTSIAHPRTDLISPSKNIAQWCFAPDSRSILTIDSQGELARWSGTDFQNKEAMLQTGTTGLHDDYDSFSIYYRFSRDGHFLARGSDDGNMSVWDVERRTRVAAFRPAAGKVCPDDFLANGNRLLLDSIGDNRLIEWDLPANREIQSWPVPPSRTRTALSPDERQLIVMGSEGDSQLRNMTSQGNMNQPMNLMEVSDMAFAPSGKWLAASTYLGFARVWDAASGQEAATLRGFALAECSIAFSPDSRRLATGGAEATDALKLWMVDGWQDVLTLRGKGHGFVHAAFSLDGNSVGVVSLGNLQIWQAPSWDQIAAAEAQLTERRSPATLK